MWGVCFCCAAAVVAAGCVSVPRPAVGDGQNSPRAGEGRVADVRLVNLNTATREELERLPGLGETLAARVVEHRGRYGPFRRPEHLLMVRGISEQKFCAFRHLVTAE